MMFLPTQGGLPVSYFDENHQVGTGVLVWQILLMGWRPREPGITLDIPVSLKEQMSSGQLSGIAETLSPQWTQNNPEVSIKAVSAEQIQIFGSRLEREINCDIEGYLNHVRSYKVWHDIFLKLLQQHEIRTHTDYGPDRRLWSCLDAAKIKHDMCGPLPDKTAMHLHADGKLSLSIGGVTPLVEIIYPRNEKPSEPEPIRVPVRAAFQCEYSTARLPAPGL